MTLPLTVVMLAYWPYRRRPSCYSAFRSQRRGSVPSGVGDVSGL